MSTYETIFISVSDLPQDKIEANVEKVKSLITKAEGKILALELWGRRKLAYPIQRNRDGFYIYLLHRSRPEIPALLDRHFRLTETILRGITVKVDPRYIDKVQPSARSNPGEAQAGKTVTAAVPQEGEISQGKEDSPNKTAAEEVSG